MIVRALALGFVSALFAVPSEGADLSPTELSPNDISVLLPLPGPGETDRLPKPSDRGDAGELLSERTFEAIPALEADSISATYRKLRAVAIRVDPCGGRVAGDACRPEVRIVWQPFVRAKEGPTAIDAAVHTFYDVDPARFAKLIEQLREWRAKSGAPPTGERIGVHPLLRKSGLASELARRFLRIFFGVAGESSLNRITFMQLTGNQNVWIFGGFDRPRGSVLLPAPIPRIADTNQSFINTSLDPSRFRGSLVPAPSDGPRIGRLLVDSDAIGSAPSAEVEEMALAATLLENPLRFDARTADCASCHLAEPARVHLFRRFPELAKRVDPFRFRSRSGIESSVEPSPEKSTRLRAFGYDGRRPAISQRVANETAAILERLAAIHTEPHSFDSDREGAHRSK